MLWPEGFRSSDYQCNGIGIHATTSPLEPSKPVLLLLHGYPQTHVMWHACAPALVERFNLVMPDLRGYGDSQKPQGLPDHSNYSKRSMAADMADLMTQLGHQRFYLAGHDRGARVAHRMMLDHGERVIKGCVMDICPTYHMFKTASQHFATGYYHWFFLIQPDGLPENMIGKDPAYYLQEKLKRWSAPNTSFNEAAVEEYLRCFCNETAIHATCEDYRAAASIDLEHDEQNEGANIKCPLLVLWGEKGFVNRTYEVINVWREWADDVRGYTLDCGHFLPEEKPAETSRALIDFFLS